MEFLESEVRQVGVALDLAASWAPIRAPRPGRTRHCLLMGFDGEPAPMVLRALDGLVDPATIDGMPGFLRNADQLTGLMILAGPGGGDIGLLR